MTNRYDAYRRARSPMDYPAPMGNRRWILLFLIIALGACMLGAVIVPAGLGYIVGSRELDGQRREAAIVHFNRGLGYLAENYPELAAAEFDVALQYDAAFEPAREKLAELTTPRGAGTPAPQAQDRVAATLFDESRGLIAQKQWSDAILRLEQLRTLNANYRVAEVKQLLYQAYVEGGKEAVAGGHIELARERFDAALALNNSDPEITRQRDFAALYLEGKQAVGYNWQIASQKFGLLYQRDPNYHDVKKQVFEAHTQYGDLAAKTSPCLAAREYDSALSVTQDATVANKRAQAMAQCRNVITNPPTPTPLISPTITATITATVPATLSVEVYAYKIAPALDKQCVSGVGTLSGVVRDTAGRPIANAYVGFATDGVPIVATRTNGIGQYQFTLGKDSAAIMLAVLAADGKTPFASLATIPYPGGYNAGCHTVVDWQRVQ
jgi:tetratricopeptide (TPR) repeat protein